MTVESPGRDIVAVQMLRGIAAMMVVFVHMDTQLSRLRYGPLGSHWLASGVDIFFVISGFIMWTSVERRAGISAMSFLKSRIIRIVPLYWLVTTMVVGVALLAPQALKTTVFEPWHVLASYFFIPARHPTTGAFWPILIPGWSLNYEMLFYIVFAIAIAIAGARRAVRFAAITIMLLCIMLLGQLTSSRIDVMNFYKNPVLLEFLAGVLVGILFRSGLVRGSRLWLGVTAIGFAMLWANSRFDGGIVGVSVAATIIVAGAVFALPLRHNPLSSLGDASYSLYLTHTLVLAAIGLLWQHAFPWTPWWLFVACALATAMGAAFAMYRFFEVPATAKLKAMTSARKSPETGVAPIRAG